MGSVISIFRRADLETAAQLDVLEKNLILQSKRKERAHLQQGKLVRQFWYYG